jgi:hypothetical protein
MSNDGYKTGLKLGYAVSDEMLAVIGCAVVCQSHIEIQLAAQVIQLMGVDQQKGFAVTASMSFKNLCASLSSLVLQIIDGTDARYNRFKEIMGKLHHFEELRNQVAHSVWSHSKDFSKSRATRIKTTARQNQGLKQHWEEVELERLSSEIEKVNTAFVELVFLVAEITGKPIKTIS